jgi:hypothetical protein
MNMIGSGLDELVFFLQFLTCGGIEAMMPSESSRMPWLSCFPIRGFCAEMKTLLVRGAAEFPKLWRLRKAHRGGKADVVYRNIEEDLRRSADGSARAMPPWATRCPCTLGARTRKNALPGLCKEKRNGFEGTGRSRFRLIRSPFWGVDFAASKTFGHPCGNYQRGSYLVA